MPIEGDFGASEQASIGAQKSGLGVNSTTSVGPTNLYRVIRYLIFKVQYESKNSTK